MSKAIPWLPPECLRSDLAASRVSGVVEDWSRKWMASGKWTVLGPWTDADVEKKGESWALLRDGLRANLFGAPQAGVRLALTMLGETARTSFSRQDLAFLRRLAGRALDDLNDALEAMLPGSNVAAEGAMEPAWTLRIGPANGPVLKVRVAQSTLCVLTRGSYRPSTLPQLEARKSAWAGLSVPIAAHLGSATIPLAELERLEPGDVIVLDRQINEPAKLLVADQLTDMPCSISRQDAAMVLQLEDAL